jgi:hypothetical protein
MINTILLYDNQDTTLGTFFNLCANKFMHLHNAVYNQSVAAIHKTDNSNKQAIESSLSEYNNSKFLFVSFLHGDEDTMYIASDKIVSSANAYFFSNAFCYTFSCHCGRNLANVLLQNNACVFWGYIDKAYSITDREEDFADLAISGLKHFFENKTIEESHNAVTEEYTNKIDDLYQTDFFTAAYLLHNRDSMIVLGNKSLTANDFKILQ